MPAGTPNDGLTADSESGNSPDVGNMKIEEKIADLLVTDERCAQAWSVQVKATIQPAVRSHGNYWLLNREAKDLRARSHVYVFVSGRADRFEFYVVPSRVVAKNVRVVRRRASTWYSWVKQKRYRDAWHLLR